MKLICYYDSLNSSNTQSSSLTPHVQHWITPHIQHWITEVANAEERHDISGDQFLFRDSADNDVPQQLNSYDCGIFTMVNADFIAMDIPLGYTQTHINLFRKKITLDILNGVHVIATMGASIVANTILSKKAMKAANER